MTTRDFLTFLDINTIEATPAVAPINGHELEKLLSPISAEEFVETFFAKQSLYIKGHAEKFEHIFGWDRLKQAIVNSQHVKDPRHNITAAFAAGEDSGSERSMMKAHHYQVGNLLNAGATICITDIHQADAGLAKWAEAIRAQLNFAGLTGINCYISPDGSGLPMHYDKRIATSIQIAGKKRWKFSTKAAKP